MWGSDRPGNLAPVRSLVGLVGGAVSALFAWTTLIFALYLVGGNVILGRDCDLDEDGGKACNGVGTFAAENEAIVLGFFIVVAVVIGVATGIAVVRQFPRSREPEDRNERR